MIFTETNLNGAYIIEFERLEDERGFFSRVWDKKELERLNLNSNLVQCSVSFNKKKYTIRGMHYQIEPYEETKIVNCIKGKIFDVIIDLRSNSPTFKEWFGTELSFDDNKALYVPEGFVHGFQTLEDNSEVFYQITQYYMQDFSRGIMWNDDEFKIKWPHSPSIISKKDLSYPSFNENES